MVTTRRDTVKYDVANIWNRMFDESLKRFVMPLVTTGGSADSVTLVDTVLGRGTVATNDFNARQIEIMETETGSPAVGEAAAIDNAGFDGTSILTLSPTFTDSPNSGMDYMIYGQGLSPERLNDEIDRVLLATEAPHIWTPSLVQDAHFNNTTLATNYPDLGTPTTTDFVITLASSEHEVLLGERMIHIVTDALAEGVSTLGFPVTERESLLVSVMAKVTAGSLVVRLFDVTASASVKAADAIDELDWTEVRFIEPVPDNSKQVRLDLESATAASTFYISAPVVVQSSTNRFYPMPSWFTHEGMFQRAFYTPVGFSSEDPESYQALSSELGSAPRPAFQRRDRSIVPFWVQLPPHRGGNPVSLVVKRAFDALSSNSSTTTCDREYLKWRVLANLLRQENDPRWREMARSASARARELEYGGRSLEMRESRLAAV